MIDATMILFTIAESGVGFVWEIQQAVLLGLHERAIFLFAPPPIAGDYMVSVHPELGFTAVSGRRDAPNAEERSRNATELSRQWGAVCDVVQHTSRMRWPRDLDFARVRTLVPTSGGPWLAFLADQDDDVAYRLALRAAVAAHAGR
jgi:hypothetical protein